MYVCIFSPDTSSPTGPILYLISTQPSDPRISRTMGRRLNPLKALDKYM